jgi:site-specific recombinase XerC
MKPTDFSAHITSFLTHYLAAQRNVSPNTIKAYRDVFTLLLRFCRDVQGIALEKLRLEQIDVSFVEAFLDYLERERKSSPRTRNQRLAALHAINCRIMLAFVSITHSITIFPAPFITAIEMLSLCTSIPIYFLLSIEGVPFCRD